MTRLTIAAIGERICQALEFLATHYCPGDEIYLIGFSRGAFTTRCVAQWLHDLGLFAPNWEGSTHHDLKRLYETWIRANQAGKRIDFGDKVVCLHKDVSVRACAVWDTVAEVRNWYLTKKPQQLGSQVTPNIRYAIQALSLDEERINFPAEVWKQYDPQRQTLRQCWFRGFHSDVGGGKGDNSDNNFANLTLIWMCSELAKTGLRFDFQSDDWDMLEKVLLHPMYTQIKTTTLDKKYKAYLPNAVQSADRRSDLPNSRTLGWKAGGLPQGQVRAIKRRPGHGSNETIHWSVSHMASDILFCQKCPKLEGIKRGPEVHQRRYWWKIQEANVELPQERISAEELFILAKLRLPELIEELYKHEGPATEDAVQVKSDHELKGVEARQIRELNQRVNSMTLNKEGPYKRTNFPDNPRHVPTWDANHRRIEHLPVRRSPHQEGQSSSDDGSDQGEPHWSSQVRVDRKSEAMKRRYGDLRNVRR